MKNSNETLEGVLGCLAIIIILGIVLSLVPLALMLSWNALAAYFGFKTITFGIAFAITLIISLLKGLL